MASHPAAERREHPRLTVQAGVRFYHPASRRELPGRTANLSRGGLWMEVPPDLPLRAGQEIRFLELPGRPAGGRRKTPAAVNLEAPLSAAGPAQPMPATVIRVDRTSLPATGQVGVAVRFHRLLD